MNTPPRTRASKILSFIAAVALLAGGIMGARYLISTAPKAERQTPPPKSTTINTRSFTLGIHPALIITTGSVNAAQQVSLASQLSGAITWVHPALRAGERLKAGELIATIDESDYRVALEQKEAALIQAKADLAQERGEQAVARKEYALMGKKLPPEDEALTLRAPQLQKAEAALKNAEAALQKARKDLERTQIRAPFAGIVLEKNVAPGMIASSGTVLLKLLEVDMFHIVAELSTAELAYVRFGDAQGKEGSKVRIAPLTHGSQTPRVGMVLRLLPEADTASKRPKVLIALPDPLGVNQPGQTPIPVGTLVQLTIEGSPLQDVIALPWNLLRHERTVWLYAQEKLKIAPVEVLFEGRDEVLVRGFDPSLPVVTTHLGAAIEGMPLSLEGTKSQKGGK